MQIITDIKRYTQDKQGEPLKTRDGRLYTRVTIKTEEHGDKMISGFENEITKSWNIGDEVDIKVEQKGEYLNFSTPKKDDAVNSKLEQILNGITSIKLKLTNMEANMPKLTSAGTKVPDFSEVDDISPEDIPF